VQSASPEQWRTLLGAAEPVTEERLLRAPDPKIPPQICRISLKSQRSYEHLLIRQRGDVKFVAGAQEHLDIVDLYFGGDIAEMYADSHAPRFIDTLKSQRAAQRR